MLQQLAFSNYCKWQRETLSPHFAHYLILLCRLTESPLCPVASSETLSNIYTFLEFTTGKCYWHSVGGDHKCNQMSYNIQVNPLPHSKELLSLKPQPGSPALHFDEAITLFSTLRFYKWFVLLLSSLSCPAFINNERIGFYFWLPITKWKYVQRYGFFPSLYATPFSHRELHRKVGALFSCVSLYL